jgi:hypothetical protein
MCECVSACVSVCVAGWVAAWRRRYVEAPASCLMLAAGSAPCLPQCCSSIRCAAVECARATCTCTRATCARAVCARVTFVRAVCAVFCAEGEQVAELVLVSLTFVSLVLLSLVLMSLVLVLRVFVSLVLVSLVLVPLVLASLVLEPKQFVAAPCTFLCACVLRFVVTDTAKTAVVLPSLPHPFPAINMAAATPSSPIMSVWSYRTSCFRHCTTQ